MNTTKWHLIFIANSANAMGIEHVEDTDMFTLTFTLCRFKKFLSDYHSVYNSAFVHE